MTVQPSLWILRPVVGLLIVTVLSVVYLAVKARRPDAAEDLHLRACLIALSLAVSLASIPFYVRDSGQHCGSVLLPGEEDSSCESLLRFPRLTLIATLLVVGITLAISGVGLARATRSPQ